MTMNPASLQFTPAPGTLHVGDRDARRERSESPGVRKAVPDCLQSDALLQGQCSASIQHNGAIYRLQATKLGKLILTK